MGNQVNINKTNNFERDLSEADFFDFILRQGERK